MTTLSTQVSLKLPCNAHWSKHCRYQFTPAARVVTSSKGNEMVVSKSHCGARRIMRRAGIRSISKGYVAQQKYMHVL